MEAVGRSDGTSAAAGRGRLPGPGPRGLPGQEIVPPVSPHRRESPSASTTIRVGWSGPSRNLAWAIGRADVETLVGERRTPPGRVEVERGRTRAPPKISKPRPFGSPCATREIENVPTEPLANVAVKVAMSSLSTASFSSLTSPPRWPTVTPTANGTLGREGVEDGPADTGHRAADVLPEVDHVAADVGKCATPGRRGSAS